MVSAAIWKAVQDVFTFASPQILQRLICFAQSEKAEMAEGYTYFGLLLIVSMVQSLALQQACANNSTKSRASSEFRAMCYRESPASCASEHRPQLSYPRQSVLPSVTHAHLALGPRNTVHATAHW